MIWRRVMALEWRIMRRDPSLLWVLGLFSLFLVVASLAGGNHAASLEAGLNKSSTEVNERFQQLNERFTALQADTPLTSKDPRDPVWMGQEGAAQIAVLPPSPLAPIAIGERDIQPQAIRITTDLNLTAQSRSLIDNQVLVDADHSRFSNCHSASTCKKHLKNPNLH